jgi:hypothetical protein
MQSQLSNYISYRSAASLCWRIAVVMFCFFLDLKAFNFFPWVVGWIDRSGKPWKQLLSAGHPSCKLSS